MSRDKKRKSHKINTLGWLKQLEEVENAPGKKRKTVQFWKKILKEASLDWAAVGRLSSDKGEWKKVIMDKMVPITKGRNVTAIITYSSKKRK